MTTLINILEKEQTIGNILLPTSDVNICGVLSNTCKLLKDIVKNDLQKHYKEYKKKNIVSSFEKIATDKMFAYFNHPDNTKIFKSVDEYDKDIKELMKEINDDNREYLIEKIKEGYLDYVIDNSNSRGGEQVMYAYMEYEYKIFLKNAFDIEVDFDDDI